LYTKYPAIKNVKGAYEHKILGKRKENRKLRRIKSV
jgi:hypothetical protein